MPPSGTHLASLGWLQWAFPSPLLCMSAWSPWSGSLSYTRMHCKCQSLMGIHSLLHTWSIWHCVITALRLAHKATPLLGLLNALSYGPPPQSLSYKLLDRFDLWAVDSLVQAHCTPRTRSRLGPAYLEVERDKRENECLQVLHEIVEYSKTFRVCRLGHVHQRADFRGLHRVRIGVEGIPVYICRATHLERDVFIANSDFQLLSPILILLGPFGVILPRFTLASTPAVAQCASLNCPVGLHTL